MIFRLLVVLMLSSMLAHAVPSPSPQTYAVDEEDYVETHKEIYPSLKIESSATEREVNRALKEMQRRLKESEQQADKSNDLPGLISAKQALAKFAVIQKIVTNPKTRSELNAWLQDLAGKLANPFRAGPIEAPKFDFSKQLSKARKLLKERAREAKICGVILGVVALAGGGDYGKGALDDHKMAQLTQAMPQDLRGQNVYLENSAQRADPHLLTASKADEQLTGSSNSYEASDTNIENTLNQLLPSTAPLDASVSVKLENGAIVQISREKGTGGYYVIKDVAAYHHYNNNGRPYWEDFHGNLHNGEAVTINPVYAKKIRAVAGGVAYLGSDDRWYLRQINQPFDYY